MDMNDASRTARFADAETMIAADLAAIRDCMRRIVEAAGVTTDDIQSVFLTGGSAQSPALRRLFEAEFGADKMRAQDYLTSVAFGLGKWAALASKRA